VVHDLLLPAEGDAGEDESAAAAVPFDPRPDLAVRFHDRDLGDLLGMTRPTMRFGLEMLRARDPNNPGQFKRLTYDARGRTNGACVRVDGRDLLFGPDQNQRAQSGEWVAKAEPLGDDPTGRPRDGRRSVWRLRRPDVHITQVVEIVPGAQSGRLDT